jgi:hypothetical protein
MDASAGDIGMRDGAVVAQHLQGEQPVVQRLARGAAREQRRGGGIEHDEIGFLPRLEPADAIAQPQHPAPPAVARCSARNGSSAHPRIRQTLYASPNVASIEKLVPAPTSVPMPVLHAVRVGAGEIEQPRSEEQVRRRAEGDARAGFAHPCQRAIVEMDAVREDRSRPDQPEPVIDVEIIGFVGKARGDRGDLAEISDRCVWSSTSGCSASSLPASASCASDEVSAKRGVTA